MPGSFGVKDSLKYFSGVWRDEGGIRHRTFGLGDKVFTVCGLNVPTYEATWCGYDTARTVWNCDTCCRPSFYRIFMYPSVAVPRSQWRIPNYVDQSADI